MLRFIFPPPETPLGNRDINRNIPIDKPLLRFSLLGMITVKL